MYTFCRLPLIPPSRRWCFEAAQTPPDDFVSAVSLPAKCAKCVTSIINCGNQVDLSPFKIYSSFSKLPNKSLVPSSPTSTVLYILVSSYCSLIVSILTAFL
ncbi:unnamed protein product [Absidia cylindrospora]